MKKIILGFFALILSASLNAQNYVNTSNTTSPNACDGYAWFMDTVLLGSWDWYYADSNAIIQSGGYELTNLCAGDYYLIVTENGVSSTYTFTIGNGTGVDCSTFGASFIDINYPLGQQTFDGWIQAAGYGGTAPYNYSWSNGELTDMIVYLNPGNYSVSVTDANGCATLISMYLNVFTDTTVNTNLYVYPYTTNVSDEGECDGTVYFDVYGGVPPYTYTDMNGLATDQSISGLCEGVYSAYITDLNGQSFLVSYFIASPDNVIDNGGWDDTTTVILDTLTSPTLEDCIIDYLTLDSAFISNINFVTLDSIVVTWSIYDANGLTEILESYNLENGLGLYEFIIQIFCPQRATDQYIIIKETRMLTGSSSALAENNLNDINMYPNPVQDVLNIAVGKSLNTNVTVTDITGKIVYNTISNSELIKVDFSNLSKGQFVVNVSNNEQNTTTKIIK
jgi:hypothetical protein